MKQLAAALLFVACGVLLAAEPTPTSLDKLTPDQIAKLDAYVVARQLMKDVPPGQINPDAFTTMRIKQAMAVLMYPVDMSSMIGPDKDLRFRELIKGAQRQMGAAPTGMLLQGELDRLEEAARTLRERRAFPPLGNIVIRQTTGSEQIFAKGTWITEDDAFPVNYSEIACARDSQVCTMITIDIAQPNQFGSDPDFMAQYSTTTYSVISWDKDEVTALADGSCRRERLIVNSSSKQASLIVTDKDPNGCPLPTGGRIPPLGKPRVSALGDPLQEATKFYNDRQKRAQKLVYENALKAIGFTASPKQ
jgi:hypothetical protein